MIKNSLTVHNYRELQDPLRYRPGRCPHLPSWHTGWQGTLVDPDSWVRVGDQISRNSQYFSRSWDEKLLSLWRKYLTCSHSRLIFFSFDGTAEVSATPFLNSQDVPSWYSFRAVSPQPIATPPLLVRSRSSSGIQTGLKCRTWIQHKIC